MKSVFISYPHRDGGQAADFLFRRLAGAGFDVYKDDRLKSGSQFPPELIENIRQRECFAVLINESALQSEWMNREIDTALTAERLIIPIRLDGSPLPEQLKHHHALAMQTEETWWQALHKLVSDLEEDAPIPRVFNMSRQAAFRDFEVDGVLVLNEALGKHMALTEPQVIADTAREFVEIAMPCVKATNAAIVPPGHSALACAVLSNFMGRNLLPRIYWPYRPAEKENYRISSTHCVLLQEIREQAHQER